MFRDSWNVMRSGATEQALSQMQANFDEDPDSSSVMELGVARLWLKDYRAAWEHFSHFNDKHPKHASTTYGMAGVAQWCLGNPGEAVKQWQVGLRCDYADVGQFRIPLLLFFASELVPTHFSNNIALELLSARARQEGVQWWPLPLAEFILGRIDEDELRARCFEERFADEALRRHETIVHHWLTDFYVAVIEHARGHLDRYYEQMHKVGSTSWEDFDEQEDIFLSKLWHEEFFLARHEAERAAVMR
jgi:lipoprotein NlpI